MNVCYIVHLISYPRVGNKAWTLALDWPGNQGFNEAKDEPWFSWTTAEEAGQIRSFGNLTFLRVYDAGHMVSLMCYTDALCISVLTRYVSFCC